MDSIRNDIAKIKENLTMLRGEKPASSWATARNTIKLSSIKKSLPPDLAGLAERIASKKARAQQTSTPKAALIVKAKTPINIKRPVPVPVPPRHETETKEGDKIYYLSRCRVVRRSPKNALYILVKKKKRYISNILKRKKSLKSCA